LLIQLYDEELNHISSKEREIVKDLRDIINHLIENGFLEERKNKSSMVIVLRKLLNISSLENIPNIMATGAYRVSKKKNADPYILFAWLRMCELYTNNIGVKNNLNIEKLRSKIPEIKKVMFDDANTIRKKLQKNFSECGIKFEIVQHFTGAPVHGVISYNDTGTLSLIMTIRQSYADIFWFTLMH